MVFMILDAAFGDWEVGARVLEGGVLIYMWCCGGLSHILFSAGWFGS